MMRRRSRPAGPGLHVDPVLLSDTEVRLGVGDGRDDYEIRYAVSGGRFGRPADALVPLLLQPAMSMRQSVRIPDGVSPRLLGNLDLIQAVFSSWNPRLKPVEVLAEQREPSAPQGSGVACLFSGGVDSFYTALKHRDEITHLVFVHGFDIDLADGRRRAAALSTVREVAEQMGKQLVEVETNLRSFSDSHADWILYFGSAMASVSLLLQRDFRRVFFAAGFAHSDWAQYPPPAGSHPGLDPLWSTEATEIVHSGAEATRIEKIQYLADQPLAMDHLLVCYQGAGEPYNCGRCGKCLRTMISLRLAGGLERCRTLPDEIDLDAVAAMWDRSGSQTQFMEQNLRLARERDPELARALRSSLEGHRVRSEVERWRERGRLARARVGRTMRQWRPTP
jgi:hypothetical protein